MVLMNNTIIISGTSNPNFSKKVADHLGNKLADVKINKFANGEINVVINQSVRNKNCVIIQTTSSSKHNSPNDNIMELFVLLDALKRGSAKSVSIVMPYYAYERQDRKDYSRAPISAAVISKCLESLNADRIIVYDLHAGQIQGFFPNHIPLDNLYVEPYFIKYIHNFILSEFNNKDLVIVSPDDGGVKNAVRISSKLDCSCATIYKERKEANKVSKMTLMGDVRDKVVIIIDDIIDTGGTAMKAAQTLHSFGSKKIYLMATHGLLSNNAAEKLNDSLFDEIIITNTTPYICKRRFDKIKILDVSWLSAEAIKRQTTGQSLSELYDTNNTYNLEFE